MSSPDHLIALKRAVRDVPDFPRPGILFKDVTPVLLEPELFTLATALMAEPFVHSRVTHVVAIESRGFLFGAPIAVQLRAALVPVRKPGKLPAATERVEYDLEYGTDALEMHRDALGAGNRVLVVDDLLATGGTAAAAGDLVRATGAAVTGFTFLIELTGLNGRHKLASESVRALLQYP